MRYRDLRVSSCRVVRRPRSGRPGPREEVPGGRPTAVGQAGTLATPGGSRRRPSTRSECALAVEQRGEAAVPELEAGAGDHREVDVHRGLDDALGEHEPDLLGEHAEDPLAHLLDGELDRVLGLLGAAPRPPGRARAGRPPSGSTRACRPRRRGAAWGRRGTGRRRRGAASRCCAARSRARRARGGRTAASARARRPRGRPTATGVPSSTMRRELAHEAAEEAVDDERRRVLGADRTSCSAPSPWRTPWRAWRRRCARRG